MLVWVHTGRAHVRLAGGEHHQVNEGSGLWLPAGNDHELWTEPGSLAVPAWVQPAASPGAPSTPTPFSVADGWRDWLIHHYVLGIGPMTSSGYAPASILDVLTPSAPPGSPPTETHEASVYPRMPQSAAARAVAQQLLRNPTFDHTVEEWARIVASSPRTLRREFLRETNLTFSEWRTRCRLAVAREFLAAGFDVEHAAAHAGFGSRNGLTRAFREHFEITPRDYTRQDGPVERPVSTRVTRMRQIDTLLNLMAENPDMRPELPATFTAPRVNDFHVLVWTYRGEAWARVEAANYTRKKGDALWLPAGAENETGWPAGSLGIPVGDLQPGEAHFTKPLRVHFPPSWDTYLLHCSISAYTGLRPENYDHRHILDIFDSQLAAEHAHSVPMPTHARAHALATEFLRRIGSADATRDSGLPADVHEAFREETGMTFSRWRHAARMRVARDLLDAGAKPSAVARRVGYSQLSNFSRDFRRTHGWSPREYQAQRT